MASRSRVRTRAQQGAAVTEPALTLGRAARFGNHMHIQFAQSRLHRCTDIQFTTTLGNELPAG